MHLEAIINQVWRYSWKPRSSEFGGRNQATFEMSLEAVIEQVGDTLGGCDRATLDSVIVPI